MRLTHVGATRTDALNAPTSNDHGARRRPADDTATQHKQRYGTNEDPASAPEIRRLTEKGLYGSRSEEVNVRHPHIARANIKVMHDGMKRCRYYGAVERANNEGQHQSSHDDPEARPAAFATGNWW